MSIVLMKLFFFKVFHKIHIIIHFIIKKKVSTGKYWPLEMCNFPWKIFAPLTLLSIMVKFWKTSGKKIGIQIPIGIQLRGGEGLWFNLCPQPSAEALELSTL